MPRPLCRRRSGFPAVRLAVAVVLLVVVPAQATLPPPPVRLALLFGRTSWHLSKVDLPVPRGMVLFEEW